MSKTVDELKPFKVYNSGQKLYLPITETDKQHGSIIFLMAPNHESALETMQLPYLVNRRYFESYYTEKDINLIINHESGVLESVIEKDNSYLSIEENRLESEIDSNYKSKGHKSLSEFKAIPMTVQNVKKYASHTQIDFSGDYKMNGTVWIDKNDNFVAIVNTAYYDKDGHYNSEINTTTYTKKDGGASWITGMEIAKEYRGYGLSKQVLKHAMNKFHVTRLDVDKKNKVALKTYEDMGFHIYEEKKTTYKMTTEKNVLKTEESVNENRDFSSSLDPNYKSKGYISLSKFKKVPLTKENVKKYIKKAKLKFGEDDGVKGAIWVDNNGNYVGAVEAKYFSDTGEEFGNELQSINSKTKGAIWITNLEVSNDYKNHGISKQLMKYAVTQLHATRLGVDPNNKVAIKIYKDCGFHVFVKNKRYYWMTTEKDKPEISITEDIDNYSFPNIMYFSSPSKITELKGRVFLSPHIAISSLFIVDRFDILKQYAAKVLGNDIYGMDCNIGYDEWDLPKDKLNNPVNMVHMKHNIRDIIGVETGSSSGYIYSVDVSNVKDKLSSYNGSDIEKEVVYNGTKPLNIIKEIKHTVKWSLKFSEDEVKRHGEGSVITEEYAESRALKSYNIGEVIVFESKHLTAEEIKKNPEYAIKLLKSGQLEPEQRFDLSLVMIPIGIVLLLSPATFVAGMAILSATAIFYQKLYISHPSKAANESKKIIATIDKELASNSIDPRAKQTLLRLKADMSKVDSEAKIYKSNNLDPEKVSEYKKTLQSYLNKDMKDMDYIDDDLTYTAEIIYAIGMTANDIIKLGKNSANDKYTDKYADYLDKNTKEYTYFKNKKLGALGGDAAGNDWLYCVDDNSIYYFDHEESPQINMSKKFTPESFIAFSKRNFNANKEIQQALKEIQTKDKDDKSVSESSSQLSKSFKKKGDKTLATFTKHSIQDKSVNYFYQDPHNLMKHVRDTSNCTGYYYMDINAGSVIMAIVNTEKKDNGLIWIQALEVSPEYQGYGLGKELLDVAVKKLHAEFLSVNKNNEVAIKMYEKYGFHTYKESGAVLFMTLRYKITEDNGDKAELYEWE